MKKRTLLIVTLLVGVFFVGSAFAGHANFYTVQKKYTYGTTVNFINNSDSAWGDWTEWWVNGTRYIDQSGRQNFNYTFPGPGDYTVKIVAWDYIWPIWFSSDYSATVHVYKNTYPIVLVHGFAGWGREEVSLQVRPGVNVGLRYWGAGSGDLEADMNNRGFDVYTASVGPVTSVWDRACELYAQLMGTPVDYGPAHSALNSAPYNPGFTHARNANNRVNDTAHYTDGRLKNTKGAIIPKIIEGSTKRPIHLVAHSMGGQTVRMLSSLLHKGSPNAGDKGYGIPLFDGGYNGVVRSITTLATPHNGTNLTYLVDDLLDLVNGVGVDLLAAATNDSVTNALNLVYKLDVDQWSPSFQTAAVSLSPGNCAAKPAFSDVSLWDLSPCGAAELNQFMTADSDVFYFSYACEQTYRWKNDNQWYSEAADDAAYCTALSWECENYNWGGMLLPLIPFGDGMGTNAKTTAVGLTDAWKQNDGVVNTISAIKPDCDLSTSNGNGEVGKWLYLGLLNEDHMDVTGGFLGVGVEDLNGTNFFDFYNNLFNRLWELPRF
ncbi:MAG: hypothetical protein HQK79_05670 [Desulfobacterales bacterium]|nr:hypothetical protein [Desulfobacterales bacterium]